MKNPYHIPLVAYDDFLHSDGEDVHRDFYIVHAPTRGPDGVYTLCFINEDRESRALIEETNNEMKPTLTL